MSCSVSVTPGKPSLIFSNSAMNLYKSYSIFLILLSSFLLDLTSAVPLREQGTSLIESNVSLHLVKRRGCLSKSADTFVCDSTVPTVDDIIGETRPHNTINGRDSLFYNDLLQGSAIRTIKSWYDCQSTNPPADLAPIRGRVTYDTVVDDGYI